MLKGNSLFSVCVVATLAHSVVGDVVIETKRNFRPFRIYEDLPAR